MNAVMEKLVICLSMIALFVSCGKENSTSGSTIDIVTGEIRVSERSVAIYGYLNAGMPTRNLCQFGILYSENENPTMENGVFVFAEELDTDNKFEVVLKHLVPDSQYYCRAFLKNAPGVFMYGNVVTFRTVNFEVPDGAVDLGLSVFWATCNLGASKPEAYGHYFQWAGIVDVDDLNKYVYWMNCPFHIGDDDTGWTKYMLLEHRSGCYENIKPDNKSVLDPEDDAAHVSLGGGWRMPTSAEYEELLEYCTSEWTTVNGVKGVRFTSSINDNSIFLPAGGFRCDNRISGAGTSGNYWSSSRSSTMVNSCCLFFYSGNKVSIDDGARWKGMTVRPVSE